MTAIALTWGELFTAIGLLVAIFTAMSGIWWKLHLQNRKTQDQLDAFRLEVATRYVQGEHLSNMKEDLIRVEMRTLAALQGLTERFDRFLTRHQE